MISNGKHRVLFICTGNYYRSRFAEALFNHLAVEKQMNWTAFSRGLAVDQVQGDLSPFTRWALQERGIPLTRTAPLPIPLLETDLRQAHRRIALKEAEHRPLLQKQFPTWIDSIEYWRISDLDAALPTDAIPLIERQVLGLVEDLHRSEAR